jgi:ABC-2 type transport system permease protein
MASRISGFVRRVRLSAGLYLNFTQLSFRSLAIYRSAYWLGIIAQWLSYGVTFITLYIMVDTFDVLAGWNGEEVLFLYAMNLLSYAMGALFFFGPCTGLSQKIRTGEFDIALTKPVSPFVHELLNGFNFGYVSHITLSVGVLILAVLRLGLPCSFSFIALLTGMLLGAALIQSGLLIFISAWSFFFVNDNPVFDFLWTLKSFINYPLSIYPVIIQILLTLVLPLGFMNFYPSGVVLNKTGTALFPPAIGYLTPAVGLIVFVLSIFFWNWALSKYQSTGT